MRAGHFRARTLGLTAALLVAAAAFASSASAQSIPFSHWKATGSLTIKKLNQGVAFPAGSEFNGALDVPTRKLSEHATVPVFKARLTVFGIPADATLELVTRDLPRVRHRRPRRDHHDRRHLVVPDPDQEAGLAVPAAEPRGQPLPDAPNR